MEESSISCLFCEKNFTNQHCLSRHFLDIHKIPVCFEFVSKSKDNCAFLRKGGTTTEFSNTTTGWNCEKCQKSFRRKWNMERHTEACNGTIVETNAYSCHYCNKRFKHTTSKYRHFIICAKKIHQENAVKIISYKPKDIPFHTTTLNVDGIISKMKYASREELSHALLIEYATELLKCPENCCIRKTALHLSYTLVFNGTEWIKIIDRLFYPQFACELANHLSGFIYQYKDRFHIKQFDKIISYIDYMSDKGYINTTNKEYQQQIMKDFQHYVKSLRIFIHEKTLNP